MARSNDKTTWDRLKQGRLEDENSDELGLFSRGGTTRGMVVLPLAASFRPRQMAKTSANQELYGHLRSLRLGPLDGVGYAPFHLRVTRVARARLPEIPPSVRRGTHVIVAPEKHDSRRIAELGAKRNWRSRVYTLPKNHPFLKTPEGAAMSHPLAFYQRVSKLHGRSEAQNVREAKNFQIYIERAQADETVKKEEVEHDAAGPISMGNLGPTLDVRLAFWDAVNKKEERADAVLQFRLDAELPYWLKPADRREIVTRFVKVFEENKLGFWAAVHRPDVAGGTDPRNFHVHVVWHDRPVKKFGTVENPTPEFEKKKARECRGEDWITLLRRKYADAANNVIREVAKRDKQLPVKMLHPGSYESLGIHVTPQRHEGPKKTALRRAAILTRAARHNLNVEHIDQENVAKNAIRSIEDAIKNCPGWAADLSSFSLVKKLHYDHPAHRQHGQTKVSLDSLRSFLDEVEPLIAEWIEHGTAEKPRRRMILARKLEKAAELIMYWVTQHVRNRADLVAEWEKLDKSELTPPEPVAPVQIVTRRPAQSVRKPTLSRELETRPQPQRVQVTAPIQRAQAAAPVSTQSAPDHTTESKLDLLFHLAIASVTSRDETARKRLRQELTDISPADRQVALTRIRRSLAMLQDGTDAHRRLVEMESLFSDEGDKTQHDSPKPQPKRGSRNDLGR